jgi:hypothetical protein
MLVREPPNRNRRTTDNFNLQVKSQQDVNLLIKLQKWKTAVRESTRSNHWWSRSLSCFLIYSFVNKIIHKEKALPEESTWPETWLHFRGFSLYMDCVLQRIKFFSKQTMRSRQLTDTERGQHNKAYDCHDLWVSPLFPTPEKLEDITQKAINLIVVQWGLCQHVMRESGYFRVFDLLLQEHLVYSDRIPLLSFETNSFQHFFLLIHCSHSFLHSFSCAHSQVTSITYIV